ncbi:MAG: response regulator [Pseudobutyrivibrio sp.]|nr:response regulator [Pseudobutyrivibrio sp.]
MKETSGFLYQLVVAIGTAMVAATLIYFFWGQATLPSEQTYTDLSYEDYNKNWYYVVGEERTPITTPCHLEVEEGQTVVLEKTLVVSQKSDTYLSFNSIKQDVFVYVGGKARYQFSTKDTRAFGSESIGTQMMIPLHPKDNGKIIRIEMVGNNNYTGTIDAMHIGSQFGIVYHLFLQEGPKILCAIIMMLSGTVAVVIGFLIKLIYNRTLSILYAGWVVTFAGLWVVAESQVRQFITSNHSLLGNMTYVSLMFAVFGEALYFDNLQKGRYRPLYMLMCIMVFVEFILGVANQFNERANLVETLMYTFTAFIIVSSFFLITMIRDIIDGNIKTYILELIGIIVAVVSGLIMVIQYFSNPTTMNSLVFCFGLLFLMLMTYIRAIADIRNIENETYAAEEAQASSFAFLTRMSHEMRTPINAILGMNKMILRESKENNVLDYARDVNSAGNYLLGIVNEILDLSKVSAGKVEIHQEEYDLMDMIRECYSMVRPRAKASRLSFEVDMSDVLPSRLYGDREHIIQVVTNLLTNAVKYTPTGRITLTVQGRIKGGLLYLEMGVSDTGVGIAEDNIPYLFDSFSNRDAIKDKRIAGTGLGLLITKELVDLMDGTISVSSELAKGSCFTVVIPQGIRSDEPCGSFSIGPGGERRAVDRGEILDFIGRVLVVDDVAINLRVFTMLLKDTGLKTEVAQSGEEAIKKMNRTKYDLVFMDHLMPGMDGIKVKEIIDSEPENPNRDTPIIMQTANAIVGAKEYYERKGFSDYISKPIKEEELRAIIKKYLL